MDRLQLATLVSWTNGEGIQGRKRLQKVVFLLQKAGCSLDCQFTLHHFGPYSRDVADACDEMVAAGLLNERTPDSGQQGYSYGLAPQTVELLGKVDDPRMKRYQVIGTELIGEDLWSLELGSTIGLYYEQTNDWDEATTKACEFKKVPVDAQPSQDARQLAERVFAVSKLGQ